MKLVQNCRVVEGDNFLHPILIKYEQDGQVYERLTSAEEVLEMFEKSAQQPRAADLANESAKIQRLVGSPNR